jgi:methyl-accepting chemotaxis protein
MNIKSKLLLLSIGCAFFPILIISSMSYITTKDKLESNISDQITSVAEKTMSKVEEDFVDAVVDLNAWGSSMLMQDIAIDDDDGAIKGHLKGLTGYFPFFAEAMTLNDQGMVIASTLEKNMNLDLSNEAWVKKVFQGGSTQGMVSMSPFTGQAGVLVAIPIKADYDKDTTIGILAAVIDWGYIKERLASYSVFQGEQNQFARLLMVNNKTGTALYSTGGGNELEQLSDDQIPARSESVQEAMLLGMNMLIATATSKPGEMFKNPGWTLYAMVDTNNAYRSINKFRNNTIILGVLVLVILAFIAKIAANRITQPITTITEALKEIANGEGDLTKRLDERARDEVGNLAHTFNVFMEKLQAIITDLSTNMLTLSAESEQLNLVTDQTHEAATSQKNGTKQVAMAMEEVSVAALQVSKDSATAVDEANIASAESDAGKQIMCQTIDQIDSLASGIGQAAEVIESLDNHSNDIGKVLTVICEIAEQTNLLALNAAIEAARAGEHGRGFAVVADEVRSLARRTQESTQEIQITVEELQSGVANSIAVMKQAKADANQSVEQAGKADKSLEAITNASESITNIIASIAAAAQQQANTVEESTKSVALINDGARQTATNVGETKTCVENLKELSGNLQSIVGQFKI